MKEDLDNMDTFIENIESYPPPSKKKEYVSLKIFLLGALLGSFITYAVGATIVLSLLEKEEQPTCIKHYFEDNSTIQVPCP